MTTTDPTWEEGNRVALRYDPEAIGRVVKAGLEVSEVKFANGAYRYVPNYDLMFAKGEQS